MTEEWKDITGFEGVYQISTTGRVRLLGKSYRRWSPQSNKIIDVPLPSRIIKQGLRWRTYPSVRVAKNSSRVTLVIHQLVAKAFIDNPDKKPFINHKNGIKTDNRVENLEWCTAAENVRHAFNLGLIGSLKGSRNGRSKLTEDDVKKIRTMNCKYAEIAKTFSISETTVGEIKTRKKWQHVQ